MADTVLLSHKNTHSVCTLHLHTARRYRVNNPPIKEKEVSVKSFPVQLHSVIRLRSVVQISPHTLTSAPAEGDSSLHVPSISEPSLGQNCPFTASLFLDTSQL